MSDKWETFCDESYYHMWRLRRIGQRGFDDGFHINNRDEAIALCDMLNNMEDELAEARKQIENLQWSGVHTCHDKCGRPLCVLNRQRDQLASELAESIAQEKIHYDNYVSMKDQRDRLAEALRYTLGIMEDDGYDIKWTEKGKNALAVVEGGKDE